MYSLILKHEQEFEERAPSSPQEEEKRGGEERRRRYREKREKREIQQPDAQIALGLRFFTANVNVPAFSHIWNLTSQGDLPKKVRCNAAFWFCVGPALVPNCHSQSLLQVSTEQN